MPTIQNRYRHLRRHDVAVLAWSLLSTTSTAILTVLQFGEHATVGHWVGAAVLVLGSAGAIAEAAVQSNARRSAAERETRRKLARSLVEDLCAGAIPLMSRCPESTAAVVFLPDTAGVLRTAFTYNKEGKPDRSLSFRSLEGCTGHAWATRVQTFADLSEATAAQLQQTWKLSPEYVTLTQHLRVVVSTPIWADDDPERLVGIVSIDSEVPDAECGLTSQRSLDTALQLAASVARILSLAELA